MEIQLFLSPKKCLFFLIKKFGSKRYNDNITL